MKEKLKIISHCLIIAYGLIYPHKQGFETHVLGLAFLFGFSHQKRKSFVGPLNFSPKACFNCVGTCVRTITKSIRKIDESRKKKKHS